MRRRPGRVEGNFYALFAESGAHLVTGAGLVAELLDPQADHGAIAEEMREAEHRADETTHRIIKAVNSSALVPFDREDVHRLARCLDDVMDHMDECVDLVEVYEVEALPVAFADQVQVLQRGCELTAQAMTRLRGLVDLEEFCFEINRLENQADRTHRRILADLFGGEYRTLEVLKLKDVVESIESAIDALETVANTVEQIVVKES